MMPEATFVNTFPGMKQHIPPTKESLWWEEALRGLGEAEQVTLNRWGTLGQSGSQTDTGNDKSQDKT